jgi:hypothetical protein
LLVVRRRNGNALALDVRLLLSPLGFGLEPHRVPLQAFGLGPLLHFQTTLFGLYLSRSLDALHVRASQVGRPPHLKLNRHD